MRLNLFLLDFVNFFGLLSQWFSIVDLRLHHLDWMVIRSWHDILALRLELALEFLNCIINKFLVLVHLLDRLLHMLVLL